MKIKINKYTNKEITKLINKVTRTTNRLVNNNWHFYCKKAFS